MWQWPAFPPQTSEYQLGDIVSVSAPQGTAITISSPWADGVFTVEINGRAFEYTALVTDTVEDILLGIFLVLSEQQTMIDVAVDDADSPTMVMLQGKTFGEAFDVAVSNAGPPVPFIFAETMQEAVEGNIVGPIRVLSAAKVWTKDANGDPLEVTSIRGRRMIEGRVEASDLLTQTSPLVDIDSRDVAVFVARTREIR